MTYKTTQEKKSVFPLLLFLLALVVQFWFLFFVVEPSAFFYKYWELAQRLRGEVKPALEVFYSSPFYIAFLAGGQGSGLTYLDIQVLQVLLGAVNCWLIYQAGSLFLNRMVARLASLAAVFYLPFLIYNLSFLPAVWIITFNLSALIFLGTYLQEKKPVFLMGAGLFIGLSIITRPNFAIFFVLIVFYFIFQPQIYNKFVAADFSLRDMAHPAPVPVGLPSGGVPTGKGCGYQYPNEADFKKREGLPLKLKQVALVMVPVILVILPVSIFNYLQTGEAIPVTASGGWVFYCANNERVKGFNFSPPPEFNACLSTYYSRPQGEKLNYLEHILSLQMVRERTGKRVTPGQASRYWMKQGLFFIRENRGAYLILLGKKLLAAVNGYEAHDVPEVLEKAYQAKSCPLLSLRIILPLALLALIIIRPCFSGWILYLYLLSYLISFLAMYVTPRFRLPLAPVFLLFAAAAVEKFWRQLQQKKWKLLVRNIILLLVLTTLVNFRPPDIRRDQEITRPAFRYEWKGLTFMKEARWQEAEESFQKALELNPNSYLARYNLKLLRSKNSSH